MSKVKVGDLIQWKPEYHGCLGITKEPMVVTEVDDDGQFRHNGLQDWWVLYERDNEIVEPSDPVPCIDESRASVGRYAHLAEIHAELDSIVRAKNKGLEESSTVDRCSKCGIGVENAMCLDDRDRCSSCTGRPTPFDLAISVGGSHGKPKIKSCISPEVVIQSFTHTLACEALLGRIKAILPDVTADTTVGEMIDLCVSNGVDLTLRGFLE